MSLPLSPGSVKDPRVEIAHRHYYGVCKKQKNGRSRVGKDRSGNCRVTATATVRRLTLYVLQVLFVIECGGRGEEGGGSGGIFRSQNINIGLSFV